MTPIVVDLSHHNTVSDFSCFTSAKILGVIHKASQGSGFVDKQCAPRRKQSLTAGLLFGVYHFLDISDVNKQVENFLAQTIPGDLLAVDYEKNPADEKTPSLTMLKQFIRRIANATGQMPVIYSGNSLKENLPNSDPEISACRLWLADYGEDYTLPKGFSSFWLRQYTDEGKIAGITGLLDLNEGDPSNVKLSWIGASPNVPAVGEVILSVPKGTKYRVVEV